MGNWVILTWEGDWKDPGEDDVPSQPRGFQKSKRKLVLALAAAELAAYRSEGMERGQLEVRGNQWRSGVLRQ